MKQSFSIFSFLAFAFTVEAATNAIPQNPLAGTNAVPKKTPPVVVKWEELKPPGNFIMALARDNAGNVWAGTERRGVWRRQGNEEVRRMNDEIKTSA